VKKLLRWGSIKGIIKVANVYLPRQQPYKIFRGMKV